jgi:hypothetical protein
MSSGYNHKAGVSPPKLAVQPRGASPLLQLNDYPTLFSWTNGTPTPSAFTTSAVSIAGLTNGFEMTVPALSYTQMLTLYLGLYASSGTVQAFFDDFTAVPFIDSLKSFYNTAPGVCTLIFFSAYSNTTLRVRYTSSAQYDMTYGGNVWLAAATLSPSTLPPQPPLLNWAIAQGVFTLSFSTQTNRSYTVEWTDSLSPPYWQDLTNFMGDGSMAFVSDLLPSADIRLFRVRAQ